MTSMFYMSITDRISIDDWSQSYAAAFNQVVPAYRRLNWWI
jgi:hypothetical protein